MNSRLARVPILPCRRAEAEKRDRRPVATHYGYVALTLDSSPPAWHLPDHETAMRLEWPHLPAGLQAHISEYCGSRVVSADTNDSGFLPGLASTVRCENGDTFFVKGAPIPALASVADAYRHEAQVLHKLRGWPGVATLRWQFSDTDWVFFGTDVLPGHQPVRPWRKADVLATLETLTRLQEPDASTLGLDPFAASLPSMAQVWEEAHRLIGPRPWLPYAEQLSKTVGEVTDGTHLVHGSVRHDNVLLHQGHAALCDWGSSARGASWIDSVLLLAAVHGDRGPAQVLLLEHPLTRDVPADHIDALLATYAALWTILADRPAVSNSPHLRESQAWYRDAAWSWLRYRRHW